MSVQMNQLNDADWIAVDWGTTNLRAYAMCGASVRARAQSENGMSGLAPHAFEAALENLIATWALPDVPVVACGMVGARQGWIETPYQFVPCAPIAAELTRAPTRSGRRVFVMPGLAQKDPADVMRGEETQIAGFLARNPNWDGVLCLPGTHTKWAHLSAGEVVSFRTFMTGELFALLSEHSVLRHSVAEETFPEDSFLEAVADAITRPERLAARLFTLRADDILHGTPTGSARAALSGYLIGAELAAARAYWLGQNIAVLGSGAQAQAYRAALQQQGVAVLMAQHEDATLAGLTAAYGVAKEMT